MSSDRFGDGFEVFVGGGRAWRFVSDAEAFRFAHAWPLTFVDDVHFDLGEGTESRIVASSGEDDVVFFAATR